MSEKFEVGEIVILVWERVPPFAYAGQEVTIIDAEGKLYPGDDYGICTRDGHHWGVMASQLRRRPPPFDWNALAYSKPRDVETV